MKKTYINPSMEVIKISTQQMLAGSPQGTLDSDQTITGSSGFGGRGMGDNWEDNEDF